MAGLSSRIKGEGIQSIAANGVYRVDVTVDNADVQAQFAVSNRATVAQGFTVEVCGTDGLEALTIFPQTTGTFETDAPFVIKNSNASPVPVTVGRIFLRGVSRLPGGDGAVVPTPPGGSGSSGSGSLGLGAGRNQQPR